MAAINWSQILALQVRFSMQGNKLSSTFHYFVSAPVQISTDTETLATAFNTAIGPLLAAAQSTEVRYEGVYCYGIKPETFRTFEAFGTGTGGTRVGHALPSNLALVIGVMQEEVSSKANNRVYIPGLLETDQVDGLFDGVLLGSGVVFDLCAGLVESLDLGGGREGRLVAVKRNENGNPIEPVGYSVATVVPKLPVYNQRRRLVEQNSFVP